MAKCSKSQIREPKTGLRWNIPAAQRQRIQMVLLRESGMTQPAITVAMGVSLSTVNRAHMDFDHGGIEALKPKPSLSRYVGWTRQYTPAQSIRSICATIPREVRKSVTARRQPSQA
jgi:hypothetical protein